MLLFHLQGGLKAAETLLQVLFLHKHFFQMGKLTIPSPFFNRPNSDWASGTPSLTSPGQPRHAHGGAVL